jgi:hypothetical protein
MAKKQKKVKNWDKLPEEEIMQMRIRDLNLQIPGSNLEACVQRLYEELEAKGIDFKPPCFLADEWFCPDKIPIIGIPFYLAHPRLKQIEQKMMFEVEGGTEKQCMSLLRHECGHAINYAYQLYKKTRWHELFGLFSTRYSDTYSFQPYSRRYVIHLQDNYAQAHPDEDFAETFAVWLTPENNWNQKYKGWPVIKKLNYIEGLMERIGRKEPKVKVSGRPPWAASRMTSTLAAYYERRRKVLGPSFQGYYDDSLRRLFVTEPPSSSSIKASKLLRDHRRGLINNVTKWTGHRKYDIHKLIRRLITRCDALKLFVKDDNNDGIIGLAALLTAIANDTLRVCHERKRR